MLPRTILDTFKCSLCRNHLSVFPIHTYGDKDSVVCGRCPPKQEFLPQRENLFEELAQHIEFPCQYANSGCIEKLNPNELGSHENQCPHKSCVCPVLPIGECKWQGDYNELFEHYTTSHPALACRNLQIEIDIVNSYEENYVFYQEEETFMAQLKCDVKDGKLYCNIKLCGIESIAKELSYQISFTNNKTNYGCEIHKVQYYMLENKITNDTTVVDIQDIKSNLNNPGCVICKVTIFAKPIAKIEKTNTFVEDEDEMLKTLECPVCFDYMVPPIMQCSTGHSFCESHRAELTVCPTCQGSVGETRNYLLEQITNIISYPCKYNKFNCTYTSNARNIKEHENICTYGPCKCIIETCMWENQFSYLKAHLKDKHKDSILEISSITYIIDNGVTEEADTYITILYDKIFRLFFTRKNESFSWSLQIMDSNESCNKYMLELDLSSKTKEKIYIRKKCGPLVHYSLINEKYITRLNRKDLENFIVEDMLTYKVRIVDTN